LALQGLPLSPFSPHSLPVLSPFSLALSAHLIYSLFCSFLPLPPLFIYLFISLSLSRSVLDFHLESHNSIMSDQWYWYTSLPLVFHSPLSGCAMVLMHWGMQSNTS
jgi:hypothetical protein